MRLLHTEITPFINDFLHVDFRHQSYLASPFHKQPSFHAHPELELVFILEGYGKRIIGNKMEAFEAGDMVFIGSNVPHIWLSDKVFYEQDSHLESKVIVTYFNPKIFQQFFEKVKEFSVITEMICEASKGIKIMGKTKDVIAEKLIDLSSKTGFEKVDGLLQIMHLISISADISFIDDNRIIEPESLYPDRLIEVIKYTQKNLDRPISLKQVADIACMTEQSFCRFFKNRTKKSFTQYLCDLRIDLARTLLMETDKSITDIAYQCGFNSSSHFCKVFKDHIAETPFQYRSNFSKNFRH